MISSARREGVLAHCAAARYRTPGSMRWPWGSIRSRRPGQQGGVIDKTAGRQRLPKPLQVINAGLRFGIARLVDLVEKPQHTNATLHTVRCAFGDEKEIQRWQTILRIGKIPDSKRYDIIFLWKFSPHPQTLIPKREFVTSELMIR